MFRSNCFYLYIWFKDDRFARHVVKRFTNLSETKSKFYYYELVSDMHGKGTCIPRDSVRCIECAPNLLDDWECFLNSGYKPMSD